MTGRIAISPNAAPVSSLQAVADLASDASGYVTGHDILVDGGMFAQHPGYVS